MRSRAAIGAVVVAMLLAPCFASGQNTSVYEIRPSPESRFALVVYKTGVWKGRKHLFLFRDYRGTIHFDPASPENSTVQLAIDGASAVCQDTWVSLSDLKSRPKQGLRVDERGRRIPSWSSRRSGSFLGTAAGTRSKVHSKSVGIPNPSP